MSGECERLPDEGCEFYIESDGVVYAYPEVRTIVRLDPRTLEFVCIDQSKYRLAHEEISPIADTTVTSTVDGQDYIFRGPIYAPYTVTPIPLSDTFNRSRDAVALALENFQRGNFTTTETPDEPF